VTGQQCAGGVGSRRAAEDQVMPARKPVSSFRPTSFSFPCARTQDVNVADTGTTQAPGSHPQPFPISSFPYTTPFPVRYQSPPPHPNSSFACSAPPACDLPALVPALSFSPKLKRFLRDLGITGPSRGAFTLLGPDSVSYTRFLFDFW